MTFLEFVDTMFVSTNGHMALVLLLRLLDKLAVL